MLKSIVFTVCEHEYMNMCPPPPIIDLPAPLWFISKVNELSQMCINQLGPTLVSDETLYCSLWRGTTTKMQNVDDCESVKYVSHLVQLSHKHALKKMEYYLNTITV